MGRNEPRVSGCVCYTHSELQHSKVCKVKEKKLVEKFLAITIGSIVQHTVIDKQQGGLEKGVPHS